MKFEKSPPWLVELFGTLAERSAGQTRKMFGYPALFLDGQMFAGLFGSSMIVRLDERDRALLLALEGASQFDPMGGRPMKEYVVVPAQMLEDDDALARWLGRAEAYARALGPKKKKKKK